MVYLSICRKSRIFVTNVLGGGILRKLKAVYFNPQKESEPLIEANSMDNFSEWVKDRLKEKLPFGLSPEAEKAIRELISQELRKE